MPVDDEAAYLSSPSSTKGSPFSSKTMTSGSVLLSNACRARFVTFPHVSQTTCGGGPSRVISSTKSTSLVKRTLPSALSRDHIVASVAPRSPIESMALTSSSNVSCIQFAILGGNCASSQNCIKQPWESRHDQLQIEGMREYQLAPNPENRPISLPPRRLARASQADPLPEFECLERTAYRRTLQPFA